MLKLCAWFRVAVCMLFAVAGAAAAAAATSSDEAAIRHVLMAQFDKPEARLTVEPVVVAGDSAVASWSQGNLGGRAVLFRKGGEWRIALCGGDGVKTSKVLREAGVNAANADELVRRLVAAEGKLPASQRAKFSTFDGLVRMDPGGKHPLERNH